MTEQLKEQINLVVEAREKLGKFTDLRVESYKKWQVDNEKLLNIGKAAVVSCEEAEDKLRELTLLAYKETGNKAPAPGVGIREVPKLEYDTSVAFEWAVEHTMALKLDVSAFTKIVKASPLGFVTITNPPQATIATELKRIE